MSDISAAMVEAAQAHEWEKLVQLERSVSTLRRTLMSAQDPNVDLDEGERRLKAELIQHILDNDAEIRRHTEPWMDHVRRFLGDGARKRRVEQAYGASQL